MLGPEWDQTHPLSNTLYVSCQTIRREELTQCFYSAFDRMPRVKTSR